MTTKGDPRAEISGAELSRRTMLAVGAAAVTCSLSIPPTLDLAQNSLAVERAILAMIQSRESATQLGIAALASWPDFRDRKQVLAEALDDLQMDAASVVHADTREIAGRLAQRIRDDFAAGRTIMLDGWLLSLAETRLYALATLARE
jgi:hypothetical protein